MKSLGNILTLYLRELGIEKSVKRYEIFWIWNQVVGDQVSKMTEPQRISGGKLFVHVKNDAWRNELVFYKAQIIDKLNQYLGSRIIEDIKLI